MSFQFWPLSRGGNRNGHFESAGWGTLLIIPGWGTLCANETAHAAREILCTWGSVRLMFLHVVWKRAIFSADRR